MTRTVDADDDRAADRPGSAAGPTRRSFTALGAALGAGGLLGACSSGDGSSGDGGSGGSKSEALQFWGWVPGLEDLVATWNAANPDVPVEFHRMTGDDGKKVEAAVDAGAGPDIVQLSTHGLPDYVINERVQAITEFVRDDENLYTPASWKSVTVGEDVYGLPQGSGPTAMMYREDILQQHGIAVPTTYAEYEAAAAALHAADPGVYLAGFSPSEIGQWVQDVSQAGGSYFGIEGQAWDVVVDSPASQEVAARWQRLLDAGLLKVTEMWTPDYWAAVNAGQIATITYAAWFPVQLIENCADLAGKWKVAPQPTAGGEPVAGDSGGAANVVLAGATDLEGATKFIRWLNGDPASVTELISVGGIFPTAKSGFDDPALAEKFPYFGDQAIYDVYRDAADVTPATWTDGPANGQVDSDLTDGFGKVATGGTTFAQVLADADAAAVARLQKAGLDVVGS
ncbi:multiple sugar transport system substrate-binding protein [Kineococcus radiotolerans]|uniref:Multiple sugar transport system substrate-binding protein n=1 Tax=Kineococcus radiotolerans TaxID=131568 RepID=A0A7W4XXX5_KINRA|nr:extracellular solute-binding protein [Kineococcus radiotolerans]MBB2902536.1 multiple sugar transport system substrate-binding protein [Kineococcus radiotolerans]